MRQNIGRAFPALRVPAGAGERTQSGASLIAGIDHDNYRVEISPVADNIRESLVNDLDADIAGARSSHSG